MWCCSTIPVVKFESEFAKTRKRLFEKKNRENAFFNIHNSHLTTRRIYMFDTSAINIDNFSELF